MFEVLTVTGARPEAFALCQRWMRRQTFAGAVRWIVVDDGPEPVELEPMPSNWSVQHVRREPLWRPGQNTQQVQMQAGLYMVQTGAVAIVEDDDWYRADHLEKLAAILDTGADMTGEAPTLYYHLPTRQYRMMSNATPSLMSFAVQGDGLQALRDACDRNTRGIDAQAWALGAGLNQIVTGPETCVGIKGLPGRAGIGVGHRPGGGWGADTDWRLLRQWIGDDVDVYAGVQ